MSRVHLAALTTPPSLQAEERAASPRTSPARKQLSLYLPVPAWRQVRKVAYEEERSIHSCVLEGLGLLLAQRGLPPSPSCPGGASRSEGTHCGQGCVFTRQAVKCPACAIWLQLIKPCYH